VCVCLCARIKIIIIIRSDGLNDSENQSSAMVSIWLRNNRVRSKVKYQLKIRESPFRGKVWTSSTVNFSTLRLRLVPPIDRWNYREENECRTSILSLKIVLLLLQRQILIDFISSCQAPRGVQNHRFRYYL